MKAVIVSMLLIAGSHAQAQERLGNPISEQLFAQWVNAAMPLLDHVQLIRDSGAIPKTIPVVYEGFCDLQPIRGVRVLNKHIECSRLVSAMENK